METTTYFHIKTLSETRAVSLPSTPAEWKIPRLHLDPPKGWDLATQCWWHHWNVTWSSRECAQGPQTKPPSVLGLQFSRVLALWRGPFKLPSIRPCTHLSSPDHTLPSGSELSPVLFSTSGDLQLISLISDPTTFRGSPRFYQRSVSAYSEALFSHS